MALNINDNFIDKIRNPRDNEIYKVLSNHVLGILTKEKYFALDEKGVVKKIVTYYIDRLIVEYRSGIETKIIDEIPMTSGDMTESNNAIKVLSVELCKDQITKNRENNEKLKLFSSDNMKDQLRAFNELESTFLSFCKKIVKNKADDIPLGLVSEWLPTILLTARKKIRKGGQIEILESYIIGALENKVREWIKNKKKAQAVSSIDEDSFPAGAQIVANETPYDILSLKERMKLVISCLEELNEPDRSIYILKKSNFGLAYSYDEIKAFFTAFEAKNFSNGLFEEAFKSIPQKMNLPDGDSDEMLVELYYYWINYYENNMDQPFSPDRMVKYAQDLRYALQNLTISIVNLRKRFSRTRKRFQACVSIIFNRQ
ncbi:MAG: hypothetical protein AAF502_11080 [Bacteroidota bacterium]